MHISPRLRAILQALLVTFLWSTSWIFIKRTLDEVPALTFAGLRYTIAFLILLPALWLRRPEIRALSAKEWKLLILLGIVFYPLTQGGQFLALSYLDAISLSLLFNFIPLLVAMFSIIALGEIPSRLQWIGIAIFLFGVMLYFFPISFTNGRGTGFIFAAINVVGAATASVLGRKINREGTISPLVVTGVSMGIGSFLLLGAGITIQGLPPISLSAWGVIGWLAVVNTAFAFILWNSSLQILSAVESSIINNMMLVQIAVLAWFFLGEQPTARGLVGLAFAVVGVLLVNLKGR